MKEKVAQQSKKSVLLNEKILEHKLNASILEKNIEKDVDTLKNKCELLDADIYTLVHALDNVEKATKMIIELLNKNYKDDEYCIVPAHNSK